jgi:hypothetical protein
MHLLAAKIIAEKLGEHCPTYTAYVPPGAPGFLT